LNEAPFDPAPDPKFLFHSAAHDRVTQEIIGAIARRDGLAVLTGPEGVGKSVVCRAVVDELDRRTLTALVPGPFVSAERLLARLLAEFGLLSSDTAGRGRVDHATRSELAGALGDFLIGLKSLGAFAVIVIDAAHEVPVDVLTELAALTGGGRSQLLLVGRPSLLKKLKDPALQALAARGDVRCHLAALERTDVAPYIRHRLSVAGRRDDTMFDTSAYARLSEVSRGVPRLINLLCEQAIFEGHSAVRPTIDAALVDQAAASLRIPPPARPFAWKTAVLAALVLIALVLTVFFLL
jgi:general secretion pathway protein A